MLAGGVVVGGAYPWGACSLGPAWPAVPPASTPMDPAVTVTSGGWVVGGSAVVGGSVDGGGFVVGGAWVVGGSGGFVAGGEVDGVGGVVVTGPWLGGGAEVVWGGAAAPPVVEGVAGSSGCGCTAGDCCTAT
ncbi:MAG: hypothetical protein ACJ75M_24215 [Actinomycetes bacterium]